MPEAPLPPPAGPMRTPGHTRGPSPLPQPIPQRQPGPREAVALGAASRAVGLGSLDDAGGDGRSQVRRLEVGSTRDPQQGLKLPARTRTIELEDKSLNLP